MSKFFIERPILANVIAIITILLGAVCLLRLPVAEYPEIVPPTIQVSTSYPGASADIVATTVGIPIEQGVNGVENSIYMSSTTISLIVFACVFGGALLGIFLHAVLPQNHLTNESKDIVKLGMGLVGTMAALVLGLLVASAKGSYDTQSAELTQMSANIALLDRVLAHYGPETKEARALLHAERLRDVVVGARVDAVHLFVPAAPGRQHQHRHRDAGVAPPAQERQAVDLRQAEIENHRVVAFGLPEIFAARTVGSAVHGIPRGAERRGQLPGDPRFVLDDQDPHQR